MVQEQAQRPIIRLQRQLRGGLFAMSAVDYNGRPYPVWIEQPVEGETELVYLCPECVGWTSLTLQKAQAAGRLKRGSSRGHNNSSTLICPRCGTKWIQRDDAPYGVELEMA